MLQMMGKGFPDAVRRLLTAVLWIVLPGTSPSAGAQTVSVFSCDGPLGFDACHTTGRGELQCDITNRTEELIVPQRDDQFFAWAYDAAGTLLSSDAGNYAYPGQIVARGSGLVTFPMLPGTHRVVLCMTQPQEQPLHQVTQSATRSVDLVSVILLIPLVVGGGLALYLTLYGVVTGRFPSFKRRKALKRLLRIRWGRNVAESMAEDWVFRDEAPVEFWLSVLAGLLTALPILIFSVPLLLEELW